jgi:hypothetical protein
VQPALAKFYDGVSDEQKAQSMTPSKTIGKDQHYSDMQAGLDKLPKNMQSCAGLCYIGLGKSVECAAVSGIRVLRCDGINGQVSNPRISRVCPIFVAAFAAAMLPACTQSCDALSRGEQFSIATDLFAHPAPIYWRDRLFSKKHYPSSHACIPIAFRTVNLSEIACEVVELFDAATEDKRALPSWISVCS